MKKDDKMGAACGRIHPIGHGMFCVLPTTTHIIIEKQTSAGS